MINGIFDPVGTEYARLKERAKNINFPDNLLLEDLKLLAVALEEYSRFGFVIDSPDGIRYAQRMRCSDPEGNLRYIQHMCRAFVHEICNSTAKKSVQEEAHV